MTRTEHTQKWLEALKSGEYKQGFMTMKREEKYCPLGVARKIALNTERATIHEARIAVGLSFKEMEAILRMNDEERKTFSEIAEAIEAMIC